MTMRMLGVLHACASMLHLNAQNLGVVDSPALHLPSVKPARTLHIMTCHTRSQYAAASISLASLAHTALRQRGQATDCARGCR